MRRPISRLIAMSLVSASFAVLAPQVATAAPVHGAVVEGSIRGGTPHFRDGDVRAIVQIGDRVVVGGSFDRVAESGVQTYQENIAAYDRYTGKLDHDFLPTLDGRVRGLADGGDGTVIAVGEFNSVNGINRRKAVKLDLATGQVITAFKANANAYINDVAVANGRVYLGGVFATVKNQPRARLAAVDLTTGDPLADSDFPISTQLGWGLEVRSLDIATDGDRLLVSHTGRHVAGAYRPMLAEIDISATPALTDWSTDHYDYTCQQNRIYPWMRDAKYSPDGTWLVAVSAVGNFPVGCDVAVRFPAVPDPDGDVDFDWVGALFDTPEAVAITDSAVYVGGHFTSVMGPGTDYTDYPTGNGVKNPAGSVPRYQIAALDPADGTGLPWNPGATGFRGVLALEASEDALLGGSDGNDWGSQNRGHHGLFDLTPATDTARPETVVDLPVQNDVFSSGDDVTVSGTATDDVKMKEVDLGLRDVNSGLWIQPDGTWGAWNRQRAVTIGGATPNATWTKTYAGLPDGDYQVFAYARDHLLQWDLSPAKQNFSVSTDTQAPTGTITAPAANGVLNDTSVVFSGLATDDVSVSAVDIIVKDRNANTWLHADGTFGVWAALPTTLGTPGGASTTWDHAATLPDGSYRIEVRTTDSSGLREQPRPFHNFTVDTGVIDVDPPVVTLEDPDAEGPVPAGTRDLLGHASDDVEVDRAIFEIRNLTTGQYLHPDGTWGTYAQLPATLDGAGGEVDLMVTVSLDAGTYKVFGRAWDTSNNKSIKINQQFDVV